MQLFCWRYVARPDRWCRLHTAHRVCAAVNYIARNGGGEYVNALWARANPYAASESSKRYSPHGTRRWLGCAFSHPPHTPISTARLLWRCSVTVFTIICTVSREALVSSCHFPRPNYPLMVIHCRLFLRICQGVCWVIDRMRSRYRCIHLRHTALTQFLIIHCHKKTQRTK